MNILRVFKDMQFVGEVFTLRSGRAATVTTDPLVAVRVFVFVTIATGECVLTDRSGGTDRLSDSRGA